MYNKPVVPTTRESGSVLVDLSPYHYSHVAPANAKPWRDHPIVDAEPSLKIDPSVADRGVAWLTELVVRQRLVLFGIALIATTISYWPAQSLKLDESIESFMPIKW